MCISWLMSHAILCSYISHHLQTVQSGLRNSKLAVHHHQYQQWKVSRGRECFVLFETRHSNRALDDEDYKGNLVKGTGG